MATLRTLMLATELGGVVAAPPPALIGVFDTQDETARFCAWGNERNDYAFFYPATPDSLDRAMSRHAPYSVVIILHEADGEWHWSAEEGGQVYAYGTAFHPTRAEAWNAADTMLAELAEMAEQAATAQGGVLIWIVLPTCRNKAL